MAETWLPVVGFEGLYEVSDLGRVRSLDRVVEQHNGYALIKRKYSGRVLRPRRRGLYLTHILYDGARKRVSAVAPLVAEAFLGPRPPGLQVCHNDGAHTKNTLDNLRYDTPKGNARDTTLHGRQHKPQGEKADIREIRQLVRAGATQAAAAEVFETTQGHVSSIVNRRRWAHV